MTAKTQKPPAHLSADTRKWWQAVVDDYDLEPHHVRLLTLAGEAWDRCAEARERLKHDGIVVEGREGLKTHPAVAIERDSRLAFARLLDQLKLDTAGEPARGPGRPGAKAYPETD